MNMITDGIMQQIRAYRDRINQGDKEAQAEMRGFKKAVEFCFGEEIMEKVLKKA